MRIGLGYDSHRFAPPGPLVLGGVTIESDVRLAGHSDGDAICHAVTDAILGAAGAGDIGEMFPDNDPALAGADSIELLRRATARIKSLGWRPAQVDIVVVAERPRILPHREAMCGRIAEAMGIERRSVSIKGKTNEGMGWIGRGEGIASMAVAVLESSSS